MKNHNFYTDDKVGNLTIICQALPYRKKYGIGHKFYCCKCFCGNICFYQSSYLLAGRVKNCRKCSVIPGTQGNHSGPFPNIEVKIPGIKKKVSLTKACKILNKKYITVYQRIHRNGWSVEDALK